MGEMENISVFDLVVTILLATATFWGGLRGVVSQISAIATWILSGLAAARYGSAVGEVVSIPEPWRAPVSALIVFCAALLALNVATRFVKRAVSLAGLKEFDRQAGALFGFFKGCAICVVLTFFCVLASDKTRDLVDKSKTGPYLASVSLLLKSAFPESETMTRFETLVGTMESTQAKGSAAPSLKSEIADLETYLKNNVLSKEAADVVEEAEAGAEAKKGVVSSGWSRFLNDLRGRSGASESAATDVRVSESAASSESRESGKSRDAWSDWNVFGGRRNDEVRDGAINDGYYGEYSEYNEYGEYVESADDESLYVEESFDAYDGRGDETVETSNGWVDLTTFLTNLTGGARSASGANATNDATSGRRTANYAPAGEPLNEYLGVPTSA
ncbi:MAG: CvpA family protein, partial [Thermoguttaceae bacterium]|nr:CvpA family protein [Thermoguttaceae bacterium]